MPGDLLSQPLASLAVDTGQRNQGSHRRLGRDLAAADRLLDRQRKLAHQAQKPAHPGDASAESSCQLILAPAKAVLKLRQQPPLLQRRAAWAMGHLPLQDQRLTRVHLPHQGLDRVVAQAAKRRDTLMAVDDHIAARRLAIGDHYDRLSLAVRFQALLESTRPLARVSAQRSIRRLQLVPFQVHDGSSSKTHLSRLGPGPSWKPPR